VTEAQLEERIAALEAELARLVEARAAGRSAVACEVVDGGGTTRAMLATGHDGTVSLNLLDGSGKLRAALGLATSGPTLSLFDPQGIRRLDLHVGGDDVPRLLLFDDAGGKRLDAAVDAAGTASLGLLDPGGAAKAVMLATGAGRGVVGASRE